MSIGLSVVEARYFFCNKIRQFFLLEKWSISTITNLFSEIGNNIECKKRYIFFNY